MRMLCLLCSGLGLWVLYGLMRADWFVLTANAVALSMNGSILFVQIHQKVMRTRTGRAPS